MKTVLAYGGNMAHAQHSARALHEADALVAFVTTFAYRSGQPLSKLLDASGSPVAQRLIKQLRRRQITQIPPDKIHSYPFWEVARTAVAQFGGNPIAIDKVWDRMSHSFDALIARRYVVPGQTVQCFEYTALAAFERASQLGVGRILHLPSLDSKQFEDIQAREKERWTELRSPYDPYFDRMFARRYERRQKEIRLADVIIANSSLTARSHIAAGADAGKVFVCPLGAPPPIAEIRYHGKAGENPLRVMWAGPFSLRKGAHYLLEAWKELKAGGAAVLDVYGQQLLPDRLLASSEDSVRFHGSVPQTKLFAAYEEADVLVFPTLSDGFGMVVAEAMAHGLPVITTDQAGAADFVSPQNGLIVPAAEPPALTDALRWCLDNRLALRAMRGCALETAHGRQWSHFRRDLREALNLGLARAGYKIRVGAR